MRNQCLHLEKCGLLWPHPENWQTSGKIRTVLKSSRKLAVTWNIRTVLKSSGKLAVIWKNPDSFEIIRKIGCHLEKSGQFWNNLENWQSSGKIWVVLNVLGQLTRYFSVIRAKTFRTRKNFPGSNATLLPRFLGLWGPLTCWMSVLRVPSLAGCQFWGSPHLHNVSFEGPLTCRMSVLRVPSLAGCQFWGSPHLPDVSF